MEGSFSIASAMIERAEFPVQRNSTLNGRRLPLCETDTENTLLDELDAVTASHQA